MSVKNLSFPMNSQKDNMQNKKCDYKTLAIMTLYSNMTPKEKTDKEGKEEKYRYVYKNKIIKFTDEIEDMSGNKINTVVKNMRKLGDINNNLVTACKSDNGEIYYIINYCDDEQREYVTIENDILRTLVNAGSSNLIKIYILLKYLCRNGEKRITRNFIANEIGLSSDKKSLMVVSDCTKVLSACGLICKRSDYRYGNDIKHDVYYSIRSYKEWQEVMKKN